MAYIFKIEKNLSKLSLLNMPMQGKYKSFQLKESFFFHTFWWQFITFYLKATCFLLARSITYSTLIICWRKIGKSIVFKIFLKRSETYRLTHSLTNTQRQRKTQSWGEKINLKVHVITNLEAKLCATENVYDTLVTHSNLILQSGCWCQKTRAPKSNNYSSEDKWSHS